VPSRGGPSHAKSAVTTARSGRTLQRGFPRRDAEGGNGQRKVAKIDSLFGPLRDSVMIKPRT
jgi:hypothetical protein